MTKLNSPCGLFCFAFIDIWVVMLDNNKLKSIEIQR